MYELQRNNTLQFAWEGIRQKSRTKPPRNNGIKPRRWLVQFLSWSQHHWSNHHSEANLRKILENGRDLIACFVNLEKAYN